MGHRKFFFLCLTSGWWYGKIYAFAHVVMGKKKISIGCNVHLLYVVSSWKPCFLMDWRLLVKEHIASIG